MAVKATVKTQVDAVKNGAKYQAVKNHIQKHKMAYSIGSTIIVTSGITFLVTRRIGIVTISVAPVINNNPTISPVFNNTVNLGGHMTKMVKRLSDGKMWETVTEAADEVGCTLDVMSKHLNGHNKPHIYGEVYKIVGVGTAG